MNSLFEMPLLQVVVALVFIYALLSVLVSLLSEVFVRYFGRRGKYLQKILNDLLNDPANVNFATLLYNHESIAKLTVIRENPVYFISSWNKTRVPGALNAQQFTEAFIDVILQLGKRDEPFQIQRNEGGIAVSQIPLEEQTFSSLFKKSLDTMQGSNLKDMLMNMHLKALDSEGGYRKNLNELIAQWYDTYMDKMTRNYKSTLRWPLFFMGLIVAVGLNVDSIHLARKLYYEPELRRQLNDKAAIYAEVLNEQSDSVRKTLPGQLMAVKTLNTRLDSLLKASGKDKTEDSLLMKRLVEDTVNLRRTLNMLLKASEIPDEDQRDYAEALSNQVTRLPIGYSRREAPLTWFGRHDHGKSCHKEKCAHDADCRHEEMGADDSTPGELAKSETEAEQYYRLRNEGSRHFKFLWCLGIFITAFSLSLGAPFWYDLLRNLIGLKKSNPAK